MESSKFTPYQRLLFVFLGAATFFEGFDFFAITQVLPTIASDEVFGLTEQAEGLMVAAISAGTVVAWLLVRLADRVGRRRVLSITILGYALFTFLTGLSWNVESFTVFQFLARIFLIGEWATAMVYAAEEFPAARRGMVLGVLQALSGLGGIVCVALVPLLTQSPWGWRTIYFAGVIPLLLLAVARRKLKETTRFEEQQKAGKVQQRSLFHILSTPYRKRVLQLGLIWFVTYACSNTAVFFWKQHAMEDLHWPEPKAATTLALAALVSMPALFFAGKLLDLIGRRPGAAIIFVLTSLGVFGAYTLEEQWAMGIALTLAVFGVSSVLPVLNAFTTELIPTELRGDAFALANNLLGRLGYVVAPIGIGWAAHRWGDWAIAIRPTAVFPLVALGLIFWLLPETKAMDLEDSARLE
ncbi:MAG: MFS transporter [Myxococcota bacterium]|nr:MFS transporter [Myxococcota bacterium]